MVRMGEEVWYASYGSNMWWDRFRCYLDGGTPPGASETHVHDGARDPSPPTDSRVVRLPYRMYFAGRATRWDGGGVSFLDHARVDHHEGAWGRAWRISKEQFDDVVSQENGLSAGDLVVDLDGLDPGHTRELPDAGWYGRLLVVDTLDGLPLVTFTSPEPRTDLHAPAASYLRTLALGLAECTDMSAEDIGEYLAALPGATGAWTAAGIVALLG
jgi:hypothetical protein